MNVKLDAYHLLELYVSKLATLASDATSTSSSGGGGSASSSSSEINRLFNGTARVTSSFYSKKTSPGSDHEAAVLRITQALVRQILNTKAGRNADANKSGAL